jgi:hypothetical protein
MNAPAGGNDDHVGSGPFDLESQGRELGPFGDHRELRAGRVPEQ